MKILIAPDCRELAPYQGLLSAALERLGIECVYMSGTRRGLPITRGVRGFGADVFHLHWIDPYVRNRRSVLRRVRIVADLRLATRKRLPLVYTAHDLLPTGWRHTPLNRWMLRGVLHSARGVIVHSPGAREVLEREFGVPRQRLALIPHGDQAAHYGPALPREEARRRLGLDDRPVCLAFGAVLQTKGMGELVDWWVQAKPGVVLAVVGHVYEGNLAARMNRAAGRADNVDLRFSFQSDRQITDWFSAADCAVTNYHTIFTSGVATLARSFGVPVLLPNRLTSIDLMEPDPYVLRYDALETDFGATLERAVKLSASYEHGAIWRRETSWESVARRTADVYRAVSAGREPGNV